jgi:ribonuclease HI
MPSFLNMTNIALIPKVKDPKCVTDFRPISLYNVIYKLISKILANRLKKILPHIISPVQSAFVPGRLITDNVLAAYETLHTMHTRLKGKKGFMAIKLDMSKAYDRVEWKFLEEVMCRLGFATRWIQLIMMCVTSVQYAIVVNGEPCGNIKPERGLRQGDPISPYLFLLCAEALSALVTRANDDGTLTGVSTSRRGPRISHLFFADDSLLFCRSNLSQWNALTNVLRTYEAASGQRLNNKTSLFFSRNTKVEERDAILQSSGLPSSQRYDKYLGLPALVGKSRTTAFKTIIDRVWKKLQDWKIKFLSQAGKEILLKAVVQAIPTYCMSVFRLPKALCLEINSQMQKFWWGHQDNKSRVHWMSWGRMGRSKEAGGMGFRDFTSFNKALLAKQAWRLWSQPTSLIAQIMKAKYYPECLVLEANIGKRPSFAWRSIFSSCDLLREGQIWRVGNGRRVRIWSDRWLPNPSTYKPISPPTILDPNANVDMLIDADSKWWNTPLLEAIFSSEEVRMIQAIPISCTNQEDILRWKGTKNGVFSVKSAYHLQKEIEFASMASSSSRGEVNSIWKRIWSLPIPSVEKKILWRASNDILPTRENLCRRRIITDPLCPLCGLEAESGFHVLWQCPSAMDVWSAGNIIFQKCTFPGPGFRQVVEGLFNRCTQEEMVLFAGVARRIWRRRNDVVHGGIFSHPNVIMQNTIKAVQEFSLAQTRTEQCASQRETPPIQIWKAPALDWCKGNWDAALDTVSGRMGLGVVFRDSRGKLLVARCVTKKGCLEPAGAEALALLLAIQMCREMGYSKLHLEGDAKAVIDAVHSTEVDRSWMGHLIEDVKVELQAVLYWQLTFVRREGNKVAHDLAKFALTHSTAETWHDMPPGCIHDTLLLEQAALDG